MSTDKRLLSTDKRLMSTDPSVESVAASPLSADQGAGFTGRQSVKLYMTTRYDAWQISGVTEGLV